LIDPRKVEKLVGNCDGFVHVARELQGHPARLLRKAVGELAQAETRKLVKLVLTGWKFRLVTHVLLTSAYAATEPRRGVGL
jgi:hypothetical protein